jgi:hypothetical protein
MIYLSQAADFANDPGLMSAVDPDGDSITYSTDCGTLYDAYINIRPSSGQLQFIQEYDLDNAALGLGTAVHCKLYVTDAGGLNGKYGYKLYVTDAGGLNGKYG